MRLLSTIRLNDNQKRVLAKIAAAPTPTVAGEEISKETNLVAARNMLMKLGIITFVDNRAEITDKGQALAKEENITDDSGGLTDAGNKLAFTTATGQPEDGAQQPAAGGADPMGGADPAGGMDDPSMDMDLGDDLDMGDDAEVPEEDQIKDPLKAESFQLLKHLIN